MNEETVARGLGWFSLGLGLVELVAARPLAKFLGTKQTGLIRLSGARGLAVGVGILVLNKPKAPLLWARVGGDALDITALTRTYQNNATTRRAVGFSLVSTVAIMALDLWCARQLKPYQWPIEPQ